MKVNVTKNRKANSYEKNGNKAKILKLAFKRDLKNKAQTFLKIGVRDN